MKHFKHINKKLLWSVAILLGILLTLNTIFHWFRLPLIHLDPLEAIPHQSAFILEGNDIDVLFASQADSVGVQSLLLNNFETQHNWFRMQFPSLFTKHKLAKVSIALEKTGPQSFGALYAIDLSTLKDSTLFALKDVLAGANKEFNYEGTRYHTMKTPEGGVIAYYQYRNLLLASEYPLLLESAIRQIKHYRTNILRVPSFRVIHQEKTKGSNALYINFARLPYVLQAFVPYKNRDVLQAISHRTEWMRIDLSREQGGRIEGSYAPVISARRSANTKPQHLLDSWGAVIPDHVGLVAIRNAIDTVSADHHAYQEYVLPWFTGQWSLAIANPRTTADRVLILQSKDAEFAAHYLTKFGERNGILEDEDYQTYRIKKMMDARFLAPFNQELLLGMKQPYFVVINDFVVFTNNRLSLESLIDKHIAGQTLQNNIEFQQFAAVTNQADAGVLYLDSKAMYAFVRSMLNKDYLPYFDQTYAAEKYQWHGGWFAQENKSTVNFKMHLIHSQKDIGDQPKLAWRVALQDEIEVAPQHFWNPQKSRQEILVQDKSHQLYLLNESGEICWKNRLDGPILSSIYQVDYQENGQLQYLFNTAGKIYLLGEEGKAVGNYPLTLHSSATNGLCLTQFKHGYAYQFFVACENGHAYGFTKDGNPLPGWNPKYDVGQVKQAFQYFQKPGRDFILMLSSSGELRAYNSEGRRIFKTMKKGKGQWQKMEIIRTGKHQVVALTDETGTVNFVNHRGQVDQLNLKDVGQQPYQISFVNQPSHAQNVVALTNEQINYYSYQDHNLIKRFALELAETPDELFRVSGAVAAQNYFGTLDIDAAQICLYNTETGLCAGFPLPGSTKFSLHTLNNQQHYLLTTGFGNEVFTYQLSLRSMN